MGCLAEAEAEGCGACTHAHTLPTAAAASAPRCGGVMWGQPWATAPPVMQPQAQAQAQETGHAQEPELLLARPPLQALLATERTCCACGAVSPVRLAPAWALHLLMPLGALLHGASLRWCVLNAGTHAVGWPPHRSTLPRACLLC